MSKQWQATTRGGHQYRITGRDPEFKNLIRGAVEDGLVTINVQWTESGRSYQEYEHPYDLIPIEPETPSPAKVRVDLALAAMAYKLASDAMDAATERESEAEEQLREAMKVCEKDNAVVQIHGEIFLFQVDEEGCVFFEKTEVL
jgi:hypothetical protein